jgi:AcrR family transcriptional regulator
MPAKKKISVSKGERTRRQLMDAARSVFAETGYHNADIATICRKAGKATGVFYLYFKNKQHLLYTMISECRAEAPHGWLMHGGAEIALATDRSAAVESYWQWYKKYQPDLFALMQAATVDATFLDEWRELRAHGYNALARAIAHRQKEGFCLGIDPALGASALTGMAFFCCYNWMSQKIDFGDARVDEQKAIDTLSRLINGALSYREPGNPEKAHARPAVRRRKVAGARSTRASKGHG